MIVAGENWDAANVEAVKAAQEETTFLVHPFDQVAKLFHSVHVVFLYQTEDVVVG